jgi:hypothetical protein
VVWHTSATAAFHISDLVAESSLVRMPILNGFPRALLLLAGKLEFVMTLLLEAFKEYSFFYFLFINVRTVPINYSLIVPPFDAMQSELLTMLLNLAKVIPVTGHGGP